MSSKEAIQLAFPSDRIFLRRAQESDAAACVAIYAPFVESTTVSFEEIAPSADDMAARIRQIGARWPWLVAGTDDAVLGYAYASEHRSRAAYRWSTDVSAYVHPQAQGRGLGSHLYRTLLEILEQQGFHRAHAGIVLPNERSIALHRSAGFEHVGTYCEVGFKLGSWHDVSWWARTLKACAGLPAEPIPIGDL